MIYDEDDDGNNNNNNNFSYKSMFCSIQEHWKLVLTCMQNNSFVLFLTSISLCDIIGMIKSRRMR
jgi:hypothetical protein